VDVIRAYPRPVDNPQTVERERERERGGLFLLDQVIDLQMQMVLTPNPTVRQVGSPQCVVFMCCRYDSDSPHACVLGRDRPETRTEL
jgi:hypothetical protein